MLSAIRPNRSMRYSQAGQGVPRVNVERWRGGRAADDLGQPGQRFHDVVLTAFVTRPEEVQDLALDFEAPAARVLDSEDAQVHEPPYRRATLTQGADPELFPKDGA